MPRTLFVATAIAAPTAESFDANLGEASLMGRADLRVPKREQLERRGQRWLIAVTTLVGACVAVGVVSDQPGMLRLGVIALALAYTGHAIGRELQHRRLTRLLVDERVLRSGLTGRLQEVTALLEANRAVNSVLDLPSVLDIILGSATQLLEARGGSIMLLEGDRLRAVCVRGNAAAAGAEVSLDEGIAGRVAATLEAVVVNGDVGGRVEQVDSAMCGPLSHRGQLLGVLNVNASPGRSYSEYDLRALGLLAEQAASAIANARLYETERRQLAELMQLERHKSEFLAAVSHDLRTPLTTLVGCTKTLQRTDLPQEHRVELAAMIDRQADRLRTMIENLLTAARLEAEAPPARERVALAPLLVEVAAEAAVTGRVVEVDVPPGVEVLASAESLRRIVGNLVENAFAYGAPPVRISAEDWLDGRVLLSVLDRGDGIPPAYRARVFERFCRLDSSRHTSGMGLGLPIVRVLVAASGGSVWIDDHPGGGAAVRVLLDRA